MTHRVGPKGQVVIPKAVRDRHGIEPGDLVEVDDASGEITLRKAMSKAELVASLVGSLPPTDRDLAQELLDERRSDREREDRKLGDLQ